VLNPVDDLKDPLLCILDDALDNGTGDSEVSIRTNLNLQLPERRLQRGTVSHARDVTPHVGDAVPHELQALDPLPGGVLCRQEVERTVQNRRRPEP